MTYNAWMPRLARIASLAMILWITAAVLAPLPALAQGCSMCGSALQDEEDPLARSISASVLFMMSMPFAVTFTVAGWLIYRHRRFHAAGTESLDAFQNPNASKEEPR